MRAPVARYVGLLSVFLLLVPLTVALGGIPALAAGNLSLSATIYGSSSYRLASNPAISGDGSTVIYGQPGHWADWATRHRATVIVKEWNGSSWVSKGSLPDGANRAIGYFHDISDDGDVVSHSTTQIDEVYVFDWNGSSWVQRPVVTGSQAGVSIYRHALSGDGDVLVVGERLYDEAGETDNGKVRTLEWNGTAWTDRTPFVGTDGERLGQGRMDITADGFTISFSGSEYDSDGTEDVGRVRVATWDGSSWNERPQILGSRADSGLKGAVLSDDGLVLAFAEGQSGVSGRIRSFDWVDSSWIERATGADEDGNQFIDLDLSADGQSISVSDNSRGLLRVYDWVGDSWEQRGSDAPSFSPGGGGHYGNVASISSDGLMVATSQVYSDNGGFRSGRIDIYSSTAAQRGVAFDANGGEGTMTTQVALSSANLEANTFTRGDCTFAGWNTVAAGGGVSYAEGASYAFVASDTLYAQWDCPTPSAGSSDSSEEENSEAAPVSESPPNPSEPRIRAQGAPSPDPITPVNEPSKVSVPREAGESGAVALVGGVRQEVTGRVKEKKLGMEIFVKEASFTVGRLSLDLGVEESQGVIREHRGKPSISVVQHARANIKGAGLQPDSTLTLFMPGRDGGFETAPSLEVSADGSFEGSLNFGPSADGRPMPIGSHFVQMHGVDLDGNETVLDIPITVAQPPPKPEIVRATGDIPTLTPGQTLALNAGDEEPLQMTQAGDLRTLSGDSWRFSVSTGQIDSSSSDTIFIRDTPARFNGEGFMPGTRVDVWLFSTPTLLGSINVADDGSFDSSFAVDSAFVAPGTHTLQLQGVGEDGFVRAANLGVTVADEEPVLVPPPPGNPLNLLPLLWIGSVAAFAMILLYAITASLRRGTAAGRAGRPA